jgi:hypothetical protein
LFRSRIQPPPEQLHGWAYGADPDEAVRNVERLISEWQTQGHTFFARYATYPASFVSLLTTHTPATVHVRDALNFARIALRLGQRAEALAFAQAHASGCHEKLADALRELGMTEWIHGPNLVTIVSFSEPTTIATAHLKFGNLILLFTVMERFPEVDLGAPGPLVHAIETLPVAAFEALLRASVLRRPVQLNVWMVNRILNSRLPPKDRDALLDVLRAVAIHPRASALEKQTAKRFLKLQSKWRMFSSIEGDDLVVHAAHLEGFSSSLSITISHRDAILRDLGD